MIPHRLYRGTTGSGKTASALTHALQHAIAGEYWVTIVLPHPQWGEKFIAELYAMFGEEIFDRLIVERLSDTDRVIPRQFIFSSDHPDPYKRKLENDEFRSAFASVLVPHQEKSTINDQPLKLENLSLAIDVKQNLDTWMSDSWTHHILEKTHSVHEFAKDHVPGDLKTQLETVGKLDQKNWLMGPGSAVRLIKPVMGSPVIEVRTCMPENVDWVKFKNSGGIHVILGGDVSPDALRIHVSADFQKTVRFAKKRLLHPGIYFIDEATNYKLVDQFTADTLATIRAFGMSVWLAIQAENFPTEDITRLVNQNCEHYIFLQSDPDEAFKAARTLNAARDRYQIHHKETRYRRVEKTGEDRFETITKKSVTKGEKKSVTESQQIIQRYDEIPEEIDRYDPLSEQTDFRSQELMTQRPGWCWVNERGRAPYQMYVPLFPDSWGFPGLAEAKADECINLLKQREPYVTPVPLVYPTTPKGKKGMQK